MNVRVSVVVPARDAERTLGATLDALAAQLLDEPFEVIVVDDGSTDGTLAVATAAGVGPRVVRSDGSGAAWARNAGVAEATGEILAFTDADCEPDPAWLAQGVAALESADLVQGAVLPARRLERPFERTLSVTRPGGLFESANVFVRRELFERVGGFTQVTGGRHERPFGEDTWFGWQAVRRGARIAFCEEAIVRHAVFPGTWRGLLRERWRLRYFPPMVARIPELREHLVLRFFLSPRTLKFDLAVVSVLVGLVRRSPWALVATAPYARLVAGIASLWGRRGIPAVVAAEVVADGVGLVALIAGSRAARTLVV